MNFDQVKQKLQDLGIKIISETNVGGMDCIFIDHSNQGFGSAIVCDFKDRIIVSEKWEFYGAFNTDGNERQIHLEEPHILFEDFIKSLK